jgi:VanZ family protein
LIYAIAPTKMPMMASRGVALSLFIAACLAIVVGSMVPAMAPPGKFYIDKLVHFSAYALVATLGCFAIRPRWWPFLIAVLMGASGYIEIAQKLVGSRAASMGDFLASVLGVAVGYCFIQFMIGLQQVRQAFAR